MFWIFFVFTSEIAIANIEHNCTKYIPTTTFFTNLSCAKYTFKTSTIMYLKACPEQKVCDFTSPQENKEFFCRNNSHSPIYYPGEYCSNDSECFSNICKDNTCKGKENCNKDIDCKPGHYCLKGTCEEAVTEGKECNETKKCKANLVCNKTCIKLGSIKNGQEAINPKACSSFYITGGKCSTGPKLNEEDKDKENPKQCTYKYKDESTRTDKAICGLNKEGARYCALGEGDMELEKVVLLVKW